MPLDRANRICFIHIPKTAGTAVEQALGLFGDAMVQDRARFFGKVQSHELRVKRLSSNFLQHLTGAELEHLLGEELANYWCFTVVRDPWARFVSSFRNKDRDLCRRYAYHCDRDMESLSLSEYVEVAEWIDHPHLNPQVSFVREFSLPLRIYRQEDLAPLAKDLTHRLGREIALDLANVASMLLPDYDRAELRSIRERVARIYAEDYVMFGYNARVEEVEPEVGADAVRDIRGAGWVYGGAAAAARGDFADVELAVDACLAGSFEDDMKLVFFRALLMELERRAGPSRLISKCATELSRLAADDVPALLTAARCLLACGESAAAIETFDHALRCTDDEYLRQRRDVAGAVGAGDFACGIHHYDQHGKAEGMDWPHSAQIQDFLRQLCGGTTDLPLAINHVKENARMEFALRAFASRA